MRLQLEIRGKQISAVVEEAIKRTITFGVIELRRNKVSVTIADGEDSVTAEGSRICSLIFHKRTARYYPASFDERSRKNRVRYVFGESSCAILIARNSVFVKTNAMFPFNHFASEFELALRP